MSVLLCQFDMHRLENLLELNEFATESLKLHRISFKKRLLEMNITALSFKNRSCFVHRCRILASKDSLIVSYLRRCLSSLVQSCLTFYQRHIMSLPSQTFSDA